MSGLKPTPRMQTVLDAMATWPHPVKPSELVRVINRMSPCGWCPVGPPSDGEQCPFVSESSTRRMTTVLRALCLIGMVRDAGIHRNPMYVLVEHNPMVRT